jgi:hypothetical protein
MAEQWFRSVDEYRKYANPQWHTSYRLAGVADKGDVLGLARTYIRNHRDGIMCDGTGQVANICLHADTYGIKPRTALTAIRLGITLMGPWATEYQRRTLGNVTRALKHLA